MAFSTQMASLSHHAQPALDAPQPVQFVTDPQHWPPGAPPEPYHSQLVHEAANGPSDPPSMHAPLLSLHHPQCLIPSSHVWSTQPPQPFFEYSGQTSHSATWTTQAITTAMSVSMTFVGDLKKQEKKRSQPPKNPKGMLIPCYIRTPNPLVDLTSQ